MDFLRHAERLSRTNDETNAQKNSETKTWMEISEATWEAKSVGREIWMGTYVAMEISHVVREILAGATEILMAKESILEGWKISMRDSDFLVVVATTFGETTILAKMAISSSKMLCWSPC